MHPSRKVAGLGLLLGLSLIFSSNRLKALDELTIVKSSPEIVNDLDDDAPKAQPQAKAKPPGVNAKEAELLKGLNNNLAADRPDPKAQPKTAMGVHPNNKKDADADIPKSLESALRLLEEQQYQTAGERLRDIINFGTEADLAKAETYVKSRFKKPLAELMAMCYLQCPCQYCRGQGMVLCEKCNGTGFISCMVHYNGSGPRPGSRKEDLAAPMGMVENDKIHRSLSVCPRCRGNGYEACMNCYSTRLAFQPPTAYEREAYAAECLKLAAQILHTSEGSYGDTSRETPPAYPPRFEAKEKSMLEQVYLRDSANRVKSDIMRLWRATGYYQYALKANPLVVFQNYDNLNIQGELTKIGLRRGNLYAELYERQETMAMNRIEHSMDEAQWSDRYYSSFFGITPGTATNGGADTIFRQVIGSE